MLWMCNGNTTFAALIFIMKKVFTLLLFSGFAIVANSQCTELFISEYCEGTSQNKAIEIYNPTNTAKSLSGYFLSRYNNGGTDYNAGGRLALSGTIAPYGTWVVTNSQTTGTTGTVDPALLALADQADGPYPAPTYLNGNDALSLDFGDTKVDIFGKIGEDPGEAWTDVFPHTGGDGTWITINKTLRRKSSVDRGVTSNPLVFNPMLEYDTLPVNTWDGLRGHECVCALNSINEGKAVFFSVFPNPANADEISIPSNKNIQRIQFIDQSGCEVFVATKPQQIGSNFVVNIEGLVTGFYQLTFSLSDGTLGYSKLSVVR